MEQLWRHGEIAFVGEAVRDAANVVIHAEGFLEDDAGPCDAGERSRLSFSTARLMTWKRTSRSRTAAASRSQRDVIQAQGQAGSTQRSTCSLMTLLVFGVFTQHGNDRIGDADRHR